MKNFKIIIKNYKKMRKRLWYLKIKYEGTKI